MPSASVSAKMNSLVRDTYQANGLIRSHHQQPMASSQTSLQKIPSSSPQFLYTCNNDANQQQPNQHQHQQQQQQQQQQNQANQHHMQFPPPPPIAPLVAHTNHMPKSDQSISSLNSLIVPQTQQAQNMANNQQHTTIMPLTNGINANNHTQASMLMSPLMANKNARNTQNQYLQQQQQLLLPPPQIQQHYQQLQLQQQQQPQPQPQPIANPTILQVPSATSAISQQQVPMTTIMIPATAAAQIQSASIQIQQAALQSMANNSGQPQILVFMIPYMVNQPPTIPPTPEQASLNSTLVRQSHSTASLLRSSEQHLQHHLQQQQQQQQQLHQQQQHQQQPQPQTQQQQQISHHRAMSSLSKQDPEKFYIKANFSYRNTRNKMELSFQKGDILHVLDTLQNSDYGLQYWLATRVKSNGKDADKGLIPDKNKAEEIALEQRTLEMNQHSCAPEGSSNSGGVLSASVGRVNFLKRRAAQRSKSLCKDGWDNVVFDIGSFKLPTYERVVYKHPGFCRPVVIFGPLADVAREKLLKDYPEKYSYPAGFHQSQDHPKVIRLKGIYEIIDQGKHALLDITPSAVEKLNYVSLAPIVIFMKTDSKSIIKEFRSRAAKSLDQNARDEDTLKRDQGKSNRKLLEQSIKLEKTWYHVFTATLDLSTMGSEMWYRKLRETIENQQSANVWMSEKKSDKKIAASVAAAAAVTINPITAATSSGAPNVSPNSTSIANSSYSQNANDILFSMPNTQTSLSCLDKASVLSERFSESLNLTSKSTIDLLPDKTYGNRSQLRNAYAHSLAQKLARASSEPKLNGLISDNDDDNDIDNDDEDDDEIIKKPFPYEYENSSSISSSNGATSYGQGSMTGTSMTYQNYPPPQLTGIGKVDQQQALSRGNSNNNNICNSTNNISNSNNNNSRATLASQEGIYSRNSIVNNGTYGNGNGGSSASNYHLLPSMPSDNGCHHNQNSMTSMDNNATNSSNGNNVIDLSRNHDTRGSAFQVYSDINQNNYHYYNVNKIL